EIENDPARREVVRWRGITRLARVQDGGEEREVRLDPIRPRTARQMLACLAEGAVGDGEQKHDRKQTNHRAGRGLRGEKGGEHNETRIIAAAGDRATSISWTRGRKVAAFSRPR